MLQVVQAFKSKQESDVIIGAVDGCHIAVTCPDENAYDYVNRKLSFYWQCVIVTYTALMSVSAGQDLLMMREYFTFRHCMSHSRMIHRDFAEMGYRICLAVGLLLKPPFACMQMKNSSKKSCDSL